MENENVTTQIIEQMLGFFRPRLMNSRLIYHEFLLQTLKNFFQKLKKSEMLGVI